MNENKQLRVVLIEDHAMYRDTLQAVVNAQDRYLCVGSFSCLEDAFEDFNKGLDVDIILLDLGLPGMDGISGIPMLRMALPQAKVLVLTAFVDKEKVFAALGAGAHGYLIKSTSAGCLMDTLDEVVDGGTPLDPQIAGMVLNAFQKLQPIVNEDRLAPREQEVLQLVAKGMTKQCVAAELGISPHSVSGYLRRTFEKLHVHSLPEAVTEAIRRGLLDFSE